ncbi:MAG: cyclically-permuted mutarotase family protein [Bacteroidaceae bacterium]|nr:cyclically-permuted mutarotase family protein [Bacteroidaceae bacterium]
MNKRVFLFLLALVPLLLFAKPANSRFNNVSFTPLAPLTIGGNQGVSGQFAGTSNGCLLVAGGCNFPDVPAADGGTKTFYNQVFIHEQPLQDGQWTEVGMLPKPLAYGASVTVPEGVVCIGGTSDGQTSESEVYLLSLAADRTLVCKELPALPVGLDNFAAAYGAGYIWVAGGSSKGIPSRKAFRLKWSGGTEWEALPNIIGGARIQPAAVVQNASIGPNFYLFGGYDPAYGKAQSNGIYFDPRRGEWMPVALIHPDGEPQQMTLVGATAVASGAVHVIFFGGVNKDIFERAIQRNQLMADTATAPALRDSLRAEAQAYMRQPAQWYQFNNQLLIYHTVTDTWVRAFESPLLARAGATVVPVASGTGQPTWVLINGEEKPGVRSADVTAIDMGYTAHFGWLNWLVLILYLVGMVYLGYYFMQRANNSSDDFFKGGGRIPWWAAGISIFATMLSAITYMSIPAKAYATNWTYYPMQICILLVSFPVIKYYLPFFVRLKVTTAYEYLERRFNYATRLMASLLFIVFMVARTALVIFLPSLAMTAVTGINIYLCIVLMALITILYCTMGGVEAVVWGDVIQGIILVGGAILAAVYLIINTGEHGASDFWQIATDNHKFQMFVWSLDWKSATFWVVILGGLGNNLISYTSDQTVIQRYLTTSDEKSAARGILTNGLMSVVVTIAFFTIGTGLYTFFKTHPAELDFTMAKGDAIFPFFMMSQLPAGLAGLLIAAVFAATMSTIASNINSISTAFTVDLWSRFRPTTDAGKVRTARYAGVCAGLIGMFIAILMAMVDIQSLLDYFNTILGLLSGAIGGLFMMGIFFPRINSRAALIGFLCGTATVFYMNFYTQVNFLLFGFVSMLVSVIVALLLSYVWPQKEAQEGLTWQTLPKE